MAPSEESLEALRVAYEERRVAFDVYADCECDGSACDCEDRLDNASAYVAAMAKRVLVEAGLVPQ